MSPRETQAERLERERQELARDDAGETSPGVFASRTVRKTPQIRHGLRMSIDDAVRRRVAEADD